MRCCGQARSNGQAAGGADPSSFAPPDVLIVDAATVVQPLASLPVDGARVFVRGLLVSLIFVAGVPAGDVGQISFAGAFQAQRSFTDGVVSIFGSAPWGPPPIGDVPTMVLAPNAVGYQPALNYGVGAVACEVRATGSQVEVATTGILGFTIRLSMRGQLWTDGGGARLV